MFLVATIISVGLVEAAGPGELSDALDLVTPIAYPLKGFAYICSIYLLILLTFERYIALNAVSTGILHRKTYMESKTKVRNICFLSPLFLSKRENLALLSLNTF